MTRAIIYVPSGAFDPHAARCMQYLQDRGYEFQGIVRDDWTKAQRMLDNDQATVAIVATVEDLDPNRKPRIEVVPPDGDTEREMPPSANNDPWRRRPRHQG